MTKLFVVVIASGLSSACKKHGIDRGRGSALMKCMTSTSVPGEPLIPSGGRQRSSSGSGPGPEPPASGSDGSSVGLGALAGLVGSDVGSTSAGCVGVVTGDVAGGSPSSVSPGTASPQAAAAHKMAAPAVQRRNERGFGSSTDAIRSKTALTDPQVQVNK